MFLQLSMPDKVLIPERYLDIEPSTPLSPEELREKQKKVERIKTLIAKSKYDAHHVLIHCTPSNLCFVFVLSGPNPFCRYAINHTIKLLIQGQAVKIKVQKHTIKVQIF